MSGSNLLKSGALIVITIKIKIMRGSRLAMNNIWSRADNNNSCDHVNAS